MVCPDVVGRGRSDWLKEPIGYQIPGYAADMLALLAHLSQRLRAAGGAVVRELDWNGTRLRLVLAVPAARPRVAYVQALEDGGLLRDVREDAQDVEPGLLALVAELAPRPPAGGTEARP